MPSFASPEIEAVWTQIEGALDQLVALTRGLDAERLNWRPAAGPGASEATNSLYVVAWHALGSTEQSLLHLLCGQEGSRDREAEFRVGEQTSAAIEERWAALREGLAAALAALDAGAVEAIYEHPRRGQESGRQLLLASAHHVAVHVGHAELTRDLLPAS